MADPFSITAGAFSVVGFTLQSITALLEDIHAIKNAPKAIADLQKELSTAETVLATLDSELQGSTLEILSPNAKVILSLATTNCKRACDKFRTKLQKWTKHSTDDAIHWWDRVRVGLFAEAEVEVLSEQLRKCKDTVNAAVSTATLLATARSSKITDDIKTALSTREVELAQAIRETAEQTVEVDMRLQKLALTHPKGSGEQTNGARKEVIEELEEEIVWLRSSRKMFEALLSETHQLGTGQRLDNIDMSNGGQLLVGFINPQGRDMQIAQNISNVSASRGGRGIIGVANNVDVKSFFSKLSK
jgi:hypothetical protein